MEQIAGTSQRAAELDEAAINELRTKLRGALFTERDEGYELVRIVYNAMIDRHPRLIVQCRDVADVIASVNFACENDLLLAIRGGGHNVAGLSTCDNGMVIDLSNMRGVRVDPDRRTVRVEGGCVLGDMDHATHAFGMATPGGFVSTTGVAGLTLGGGFGHLSRQYGLTCDNMISADVVTANGQFVTASADKNDDLFWGLRGGGGNFGVVTSFEFKLHPVGTIYGGPIFYPVEKGADVLRFYREFIANAPEELSVFFGFHILPPAPFIPENLQGLTTVALVVCYNGPMDKAEKMVKPIREVTPPLLDMMMQIPYPALQQMFDPLLPPGLQHYWKADHVKELSDEAIEVHMEYGPKVPNFHSTMHIYPLNGAVQKMKNEETAYNHRDANFIHNIVAIYPDPADTPSNIEWVRSYWSALHPYSSEGTYVNFMMDEGQDRIKATYGDNYGRLVQLKNKYDPKNLFKMNQNIRPST